MQPESSESISDVSPTEPGYVGASTRATGRLKLALCFAVAAAFGGLWVWAHHAWFDTLWDKDAFDYAQLARQIHEGDGFSSLQTFPYVLGWLDAHGVATAPPWPNVTRFVLPTLLQAAAYAVVGANDFGAILPGGVFFVLGGVAVFLLGNRLHGGLVGLVSAAVLLVSPTHLGFSLSGMTETGASFMLVLAVIVLMVAVETPRRAILWCSILGLLLGLMYLHRSNLILLAPVCCAWLLWRYDWRRGLTCCFVMGAVCVLVNVPWMLRNAGQFGSPTVSLTLDRYIILGMTGSDPFKHLQQFSAAEVFLKNIDQYLVGLRQGWLMANWQGMFGEEYVWLGPAFVLSLLVPGGRRQRAVWFVTATLIALHLVTLTAANTQARYYQPFAALMLPQVVAAAFRLGARLPSRWFLLNPILGAVSVVLMTLVLMHRGDALLGRMPKGWAATRELILSEVPEDACIASNLSWAIPWCTGRTSIRFRGMPAQLSRLQEDYVQIDAVLLDGKRSFAFQGGAADGFRVVSRLPDGTTLWVRKE